MGSEPQHGSWPDVLDTVLGHAAAQPTSPALRDDTGVVTYREMADRVGDVAAALAGFGVEPGDRVALHLENSAAFVITALGCVWLGAAFVPVAVDAPPARRRAILADCRPTVVVTADATELGGGRDDRNGPPVVPLRDLFDRSGGLGAVERARRPERDAFLIYTSGTTGMPKGVRVSERALSVSSTVTAEILGLDRSVRALNVSPFHFDGSYGLLFSTLVAGGSVRVPRRQDILFLRRFFDVVLEEQIDFTSCSPSYLRLLLASRHVRRLSESLLRCILLGGEECSAEDVAHLWEVLPGLRVFNRYGPTEATIAVTTYEVRPEDVASGWVPIGVPHPGTEFVVVGPEGVIEGAGGPGELYIGGPQVMTGYWGDDALTAQVLRSDVVPGKVLYRTGDLVTRDQTGRYLYVGRSDNVVKRNGVRISLDEVARAFHAAAGVRGATSVLVNRAGEAAIAVFVEADRSVPPADLLDHARDHLLESMLPDEVVVVPALPLTPQGKVDRRRLLTGTGWKEWSGSTA